MSFAADGTVELSRSRHTGLEVWEFRWLIGTANAIKYLDVPMVGWLWKFEHSYTDLSGVPPASYDLYLYDEWETDWLQGKGGSLTVTNGIKHVFAGLGSQRVAPVPMMGKPIFRATSTVSGDRGFVRFFLRPIERCHCG